jgi:hypothetical protein
MESITNNLNLNPVPGIHHKWFWVFIFFGLKMLPFGKAIRSHILRYQGFAVDNYSCNIAALNMKPYDFCNVRVYAIKRKLTATIYS